MYDTGRMNGAPGKERVKDKKGKNGSGRVISVSKKDDEITVTSFGRSIDRDTQEADARRHRMNESDQREEGRDVNSKGAIASRADRKGGKVDEHSGDRMMSSGRKRK